ncbi:protein adenylyltransferase SelO [Cohnella boryungensis]|uniref:Protein nucleotidyltransferase YdiU n=1 Tax=Cohnella boryungensis TaxID=768479 RepID=A0ABV8S955_9BACL
MPNNPNQAGWNFDNSYAELPSQLYTRLDPTPVRSPKLVIFNGPLATSLGLDVQALQSAEGVEALAGNRVPEGALPLAQAYAGHQFGHFNMLGDGRALLLGEHLTPRGERFDIQLKGSGPTPYSRRGDGRAALGPMLREYIISEAMHALGIATTRSLAVTETGEPVYREKKQQGAVLTRVAASHIRVGTFQYAAQWGTFEELKALADYTIVRHYPEAGKRDNRYLDLLRLAIERQAALIAKWQLVGFIHGVMNTDNMALSGETIDYGPCAFMDAFDPATVFSSIDANGRYAYGNQPAIAAWNLARFAESLLPLLDESEVRAIELAEGTLAEFAGLYQAQWLDGMREKLGIFNKEPEDEALVEKLLRLMQLHRADYTNTFRALSFADLKDAVLSDSAEFTQWQEQWQRRLDRQPEPLSDSVRLMQGCNPALIPRNHLVEEALEAAVEQGNYAPMQRLLEALAQPYAHSPEQEAYAALPEPSAHPYRTFCGT